MTSGGHEALAATVQQLIDLLDATPAAVALLHGPDHVFSNCNERFIDLVGGRELLGKRAVEAVPEAAEQGFIDLLDGVRASGQPHVGRAERVELTRSVGEAPDVRFCDFVYRPLAGDSGGVDAILVVAYDVTEVVKARVAADSARRSAEISETSLRDFIDNLPDLAWTARPDGHIDHYNRRWYEYTGTTFDEMQGWGWEKVHDPALLPQVVRRWRASLETGDPFEMEFTLRGSDGIRRWFLTRVAPSRDADGAIVRWFGTNTNIDDIKTSHALSVAMAEQSLDTQRALLDMRHALERAERRVQELEAHRPQEGPA